MLHLRTADLLLATNLGVEIRRLLALGVACGVHGVLLDAVERKEPHPRLRLVLDSIETLRAPK